MNINVNVTWDPTLRFQEARLLEIIVSCDDLSLFDKYQGQLEQATVVERYVHTLFLYCGVPRESSKLNPITESDGRRLYCTGSFNHSKPLSQKSLDLIKSIAFRIQKQHYIAPRKECVRDDQYSAFFGSGGFWEIKQHKYPQGTYSERLEQTIYEMEHGNPKIWEWTNVHCEFDVSILAEKNPEFAQFCDSVLYPIYNKRLKILDLLRELAVAIAEYKKDHLVEGL